MQRALMLLNLYGSEAVRNKLKNRQKMQGWVKILMITLVSSPKQQLCKHMQYSVCSKEKISHVIRASAWNAFNLLQQDDQTTKY